MIVDRHPALPIPTSFGASASREWAAALFVAIDEAVLVVLPHGPVLNPAAQQLFRISAGDGALVDPRALHVDRKHHIEFNHRIARLIETGEPARFDFTMRRGSGEVFVAAHAMSLLRGGDGRALGVASVVRDVGRRARAFDEARFLAELSGMLGEPMEPEPLLHRVVRQAVPFAADFCAADLVGEDGAIRRVAASHADPAQEAARLSAEDDPFGPGFFGVPRVLESGQPELVEAIPPERLRRALAAGEQMELALASPPRSTLCVPLVARGQTLGALCLATTTERRLGPADMALAFELARRTAMALDNTRFFREARASLQARDDFLSIASHELKTPITSLRLAVEILIRVAKRGSEKLPDKFMVRLETAERQCRRLSQMINDLLDFSRIRAGRLELDVAEVDLSEVVREVVARLREEMGLAGYPLEVRTDKPAIGHWDRTRVEQVVTNLFSNAIKYGQGRTVGVFVEADAEAARLVVQDHGIGIAPEEQARIFQRFERAVSARSYSGLGLGLYIVHELVGALGGTVELTSTPGEGSTFTVALPYVGPRA